MTELDCPCPGSGRNLAEFRRPRRQRARLALMLIALLGCARHHAQASSPATKASPRLPLQPVTRVARDFQWRQRVTARWDQSSHTFDAVVTKAGDQLRLLGLDPMGRPGFVLTLQQGRVTVENRTGLSLPFDPRYILLDVQRAFYPWLEAAPATDGWRSQALGPHWLVAERWHAGRLRQRRFHSSSQSAPDVVVLYEDYSAESALARRVELLHRSRGYSLLIETLEQQVFAP